MNKIAKIAAAAAGVYGLGLGVTMEASKPKSMEDARRRASIPYAALDALRDAAITFGDDLALGAIAIPMLKKRLPVYGQLFDHAFSAIAIAGGGVGGTLAGHDYMKWIAARQYISQHNGLDRSQALIGDARLNTIEGFSKKGYGALQRMQTTGIGSPAAGGILWRMENNPFADAMRRAVTGDPNPQAGDPRARALAFSTIGGLLGTLLFAHGGLAKATLGGLALGTAGGAYGIIKARNPDVKQNVLATTDLALGATPIMAMGGLLYGLSSHRLGKFGNFMSARMAQSVGGIAKAGGGMIKASHWTDAQLEKINAGGRYFMRTEIARQKAWHPAFRIAQPVAKAAQFGSAVTSASNAFFVRGVGSALLHTGIDEAGNPRTSRWEQSLGLGHVLTVLPHQAAVIATSAGIIQDHRARRGKHSTTTMPSNSAR